MKKVLIVGPDFFGYNNSIARAYENLGADVKVLSYAEKNIPLNIFQKLKYYLTKDKDEYEIEVTKKINSSIRAIYDEFAPDIVLFVRGSRVLESTLDYLKDSILVLWMMDSIYETTEKEVFSIKNKYNYLFLFEKSDVDRLSSEGVCSYYLPLAYDDKIYFKQRNKKDIDILFVGNISEVRYKLFKQVIDKFPQYKIRIYGNYIPLRNLSRYIKNLFDKSFVNKNISPRKINTLYSRTKVCINMHHQQSKYGVNPRFFEIYGTETLQLVDEKQYILDRFNYSNVFTYKSNKDLLYTLKNILDDFDNVNISHLYNKVKSNDTFLSRIREIDKIIK